MLLHLLVQIFAHATTTTMPQSRATAATIADCWLDSLERNNKGAEAKFCWPRLFSMSPRLAQAAPTLPPTRRANFCALRVCKSRFASDAQQFAPAQEANLSWRRCSPRLPTPNAVLKLEFTLSGSSNEDDDDQEFARCNRSARWAGWPPLLLLLLLLLLEPKLLLQAKRIFPTWTPEEIRPDACTRCSERANGTDANDGVVTPISLPAAPSSLRFLSSFHRHVHLELVVATGSSCRGCTVVRVSSTLETKGRNGTKRLLGEEAGSGQLLGPQEAARVGVE